MLSYLVTHYLFMHVVYGGTILLGLWANALHGNMSLNFLQSST